MLSDRCLSCLYCLSVLSVFDVGVLWPNRWTDHDQTLQAGRPRSRPPHCIRWGRSSHQKGHSPQFSAYVYCGQTAGWIKMPLGTEVDLSLADFVLDGDPALHQKVAQFPQFSAHCVRWGPAPPQMGHAPNFWSMSIVAKRSPVSVTAELLLFNE